MYIHFYSASYDIAHNISHVKSDQFLIHSHPYYELHYMIDGDMEAIYDGHIIHTKPCGLTLIEPNVPHGIRVLSEKPYERYTAHFTADMISPQNRQLLLSIFHTDAMKARKNHLKGMGTTNLLHIFQELVRMETLSLDQRDLLIPPMIEALLICLYTYLQNTPAGSAENASGISAKGIRKYIDAHYTEKITLDDLASIFYCTKGYVNTVFKAETGMTTMQYILNQRLSYAHALIENGYPANQACSLAGFSDYSSFYRSYVKKYDGAPSKDTIRERDSSTLELLPREIPNYEHTSSSTEIQDGRKTIWDMYHHEAPDQDPDILHDAPKE